MKILISRDTFFATITSSDILGYMGETKARIIEFTQPIVEGADSYKLRFEYSDSVVYETPIIDNRVVVTGSMLREAKKVKCQWLATKTVGNSYELVAKSQIFKVEIKESIGDDTAPIPTYEQSLDMLDQLNEGINSKITEPEQDGTAGQVLATDGNGERYWRTVSGGGSGGEDGATFIPSVSVEGIISWTNDKGLPNPESRNIKGIQGIAGQDGLGISNATINDNGELIITLTDDTSVNVGEVVGHDGSDGQDGVSVANAEINNNGELVITLSSGETIELGVVVGSNGSDGSDGENGATFTPSVSAEGILSWTNDKSLPNPQSVNIKGATGATGATGADGIGITNATINASNELVLTYSNGQTANLGVVVGADGKDGKDGSDGSDGVSVTNSAINGSGDLIITLSSGATINAGHAVGADGQSGSDGADGISVTGATVNGNGDLVLSLSNSTTVNAGHVVGADGQDYILTSADKTEIATEVVSMLPVYSGGVE